MQMCFRYSVLKHPFHQHMLKKTADKISAVMPHMNDKFFKIQSSRLPVPAEITK